MCFELRPANYDGENVKTAVKDIVCYKKLLIRTDRNGLSFRSSVRDFKYKLGVEVSASFKFARSWQSKKKRDRIENGLHSYRNAAFGNVKCIIPAGAKYYMNKTEYCSNRIIIVELLPGTLDELRTRYTREISYYNKKIKENQLEIKKFQKILSKL